MNKVSNYFETYYFIICDIFLKAIQVEKNIFIFINIYIYIFFFFINNL